ncbi:MULTISPECIES: phage recombination protein Bet [Klebsiella/Raoultella group]|uniref:Phage recombination protein Bet n=4 Tax=Klebsiella/Raoultella group TaxID=2890311 RepID=A0A483GVM7_KLEPN|nr:MULTISPECIES: phage recombination protein Bet [Klebsiella/Raoultella group]MDU7099572.1 phage recombination protein Bet [Enterobacter sp.]DAU69651.1 MAG TPA: RecT protein [Caudoviricetes sp.]HBR1442149.1 phage recombination protein Bet [Klebsiella quasipneumoniae subsp. quasipneumoniae]HDU6249768.1 phage recombination protein Bet [Klebsiella pneumoniae subsp. ozaenae]EIW8486391.1 phage recombination protein Bet [Klebsiella pneumoniae]
MSTALSTMAGKLASRLGMDAGTDLMNTLKNTAFKGGNVTDEQFTALLIVANQYGLNPWTKEIYAFPDKGGIVPVVGVDGWARIINEHPQFDGMEFAYDKEEGACTCKIYRKDRTHPTIVTEYMGECKRNTQPWQSHPTRMLRHKTLIQCARLAFGFAGIFDQDEAERVIEGSTAEVHVGHESDGRRPELIAKGESAARLGTVKYQEFWVALSAEEKQVIGAVEKRRMYDMSLAVDNAEPVDAAAPEDK